MNNRKIDWSKVTIEDLQADPAKYGAPTFVQFCANKGKYLGRYDDAITAIGDGPTKFRKDLNKIRYQIHYVDIKESEVERALSDYGYSLADIDLENQKSTLKKKMDMIPLGGGKYDIVVNFLP